MIRILSDYLAICSKFRIDGLSKAERKQRHALLSEWEKTDSEREMLSLGEIQDFWDNHNDICWNRLFISKVICPAIADDLANGGYFEFRAGVLGAQTFPGKQEFLETLKRYKD